MAETINNYPSGSDEQKITRLQNSNEKLLHKYIAAATGSKWEILLLSCILSIIILIPLSLIGKSELNLKWPVIIAVWGWLILAMVCELAYTYPLSANHIAITPTEKLRPMLLRFNKNNWILTIVVLALLIPLFIWVAFEVRDAIAFRVLDYDFNERKSSVGFWAIIIYGIATVVLSIISTLHTTHKINKLVADIDELYIK